jgi:hypothetical protein
MGTHRDSQSPWAAWRQWRRYRRNLAALVRDWRRSGRPLTRELLDEMKAQARRAARESR